MIPFNNNTYWHPPAICQYWTHKVLDDLLDGAHAEDEYERRERGPAPRGGHVGDLLQQRNQQEEAVGVAAELLEQEQGDERRYAAEINYSLLKQKFDGWPV